MLRDGIWRWISGLGVLALLSGCGGSGLSPGSSSKSSSDFVIGLVGPITGSFAEVGKNESQGAQMAIKDINQKGGFAGHPGKLVFEDDGGLPATGVNSVARAIQQDHANALLGPDLSTVTLAAIQTSEQGAIPQITSSISPAIWTKGDKWLFGGRPNDATNVDIMVKYGVQQLHVTKPALIYSNEAYGQGSLPELQKQLSHYNTPPVVQEAVQPGTKDVTAQVEAAKNAHADGILWWGLIPESAVLEKAVHQFGFEGPLYGANALVNPDTLKLAGSSADGAIAAITFSLADPNPTAQAFIKRYQSEWGGVPDDHGPLYYDMVHVLATAANKAGSIDPTKLREALLQVSYTGLTGAFKYDANGADVAGSAVIVKIISGQQTVLQDVRG